MVPVLTVTVLVDGVLVAGVLMVRVDGTNRAFEEPVPCGRRACGRLSCPFPPCVVFCGGSTPGGRPCRTLSPCRRLVVLVLSLCISLSLSLFLSFSPSLFLSFFLSFGGRGGRSPRASSPAPVSGAVLRFGGRQWCEVAFSLFLSLSLSLFLSFSLSLFLSLSSSSSSY